MKKKNVQSTLIANLEKVNLSLLMNVLERLIHIKAVYHGSSNPFKRSDLVIIMSDTSREI